MKGIKWGWIEEGNELDTSLRMMTSIRIDGGTLGALGAADLGHIQVSYYVAFKTRKHTQ